MKPLFPALLASAAVAAALSTAAQPLATFQSGGQQTRLIELYTSEGCSSCPPAERWFTQLGEDDGLWSEYVPVAFHVTYWNYLGWRDELSDRAFDQRQRRRAASAGSGVYTPGVFQDGAEFRQWRRMRSSPRRAASTAAGQLTVTVEGNEVVASYDAPLERDDLAVEIAVLGSGISSNVKAGENRGRSLQHDFVVLNLQSQTLTRTDDVWRARVSLPATNEVSKPALAAWVVNADGEPLQATGGWLP